MVDSNVWKSPCASNQIIPRLLYFFIEANADAIAILWSPPNVSGKLLLFKEFNTSVYNFWLNILISFKFFFKLFLSNYFLILFAFILIILLIFF